MISRYLRNVFDPGELSRKATVANNTTVQIEGGRDVALDERRQDSATPNRLSNSCSEPSPGTSRPTKSHGALDVTIPLPNRGC